MNAPAGYRAVRHPKVSLVAEILHLEFRKDFNGIDDRVHTSVRMHIGEHGLVHLMELWLTLDDAISIGVIEYDTATGKKVGA